MRLAVIRTTLLGIALMLLVTSCDQDQQASSNQMDYKELKTMVVDILKTEEGQKAIQEAQGSTNTVQMQSMNMQQQEQVRLAVKDTLVSPDYHKVLEQVMKDPKFAGEFAKAISKENKQLHKELIKDPSYQKSVGDILKSPDTMKAYLDAMKSPEYRKQMMTLMKDAMNSPMFKLEVMEIMSKVVKEELQPKEEKSKGDGQNSESGEESGSSGGDSESGQDKKNS
ncbi:spore germination lipoprotein GerD [Paenibacillus sp. UMB4589-SE434]|uniref:spore germination lipoprotein GerD n=1 Tax=Paenibacillus sp. UMB4589-SE434 TaxID=3046314 RepID=UPI00254C6E3E|nr:spore germination lipoprotein GerD [Paenibacillus sp. UMB4589-SE434]MDK8184207.1 spore germination lipoprotein GerD [Paenibacillus sp. UMB4589-SE434]